MRRAKSGEIKFILLKFHILVIFGSFSQFSTIFSLFLRFFLKNRFCLSLLIIKWFLVEAFLALYYTMPLSTTAQAWWTFFYPQSATLSTRSSSSQILSVAFFSSFLPTSVSSLFLTHLLIRRAYPSSLTFSSISLIFASSVVSK